MVLDFGEVKLLGSITDAYKVAEDVPPIILSMEKLLNENTEEDTDENCFGVLKHIILCFEDDVAIYISVTKIYNESCYPKHIMNYVIYVALMQNV